MDETEPENVSKEVVSAAKIQLENLNKSMETNAG